MSEFKGSSFDEIFQRLLQKSDIEKKYDSAQSMDDLFYYFSEQIALSAASIMFSLKGPKRGALILGIMNVTNQKSYTKYWDRNNRLFCQCLMVVADRLRPFFKKQIEPEDGEEILDKATGWGAGAYSGIARLSPRENSIFKKTFEEIVEEHLRNPLKDDQDQIGRIIKEHGKKPTPEEIIKLVLAMQQSLDWIHPWAFIQNWKRLARDKK